MKEITTGKRTFLAVEVPKDAKYCEVELGSLSATYGYFNAKDLGKLPKGNWRILGIVSEDEMLGEEQAKELVHSLPSVFGLTRDYKDYSKEYHVARSQYTFTTATESLISLLESEGWRVRNHIPQPEFQHDGRGNGDYCAKWVEEYELEQSQLQRLLILIKD